MFSRCDNRMRFLESRLCSSVRMSAMLSIAAAVGIARDLPLSSRVLSGRSTLADESAIESAAHCLLGRFHLIPFARRPPQLMQRVRTPDTAPEVAVRRGLWAAGPRGWQCIRRASLD